jgi:hypothetical protein
VRRTFVFDSEALSKAVRGDREVRAIIKAAPQLDITIVTSALTTIEAWNPQEGARAALWDWTLSRVGVVHTDDRLISLAQSMLKDASLHGHTYAIDAVQERSGVTGTMLVRVCSQSLNAGVAAACATPARACRSQSR